MKKTSTYLSLFIIMLFAGISNTNAQGLFYAQTVTPSVTTTDSCSGLSVDILAWMGCINFVVDPASYSITGNNIIVDINCTSSFICAGALSQPLGTVTIPSLPAGTYTVTGNAFLDRNLVNSVTGASVTVLACTATGIEESLQEKLQIGPNPANEYVTISGLQSGVNYTYDLVDLKGSQLKSAPIRNTRIALPEVAPGIYFIRVRSAEESVIKRIVIQ